MRHPLLLALSLLYWLIASAAAHAESGLFWEVEQGESRVYLLGSIHLANEDFYPLRDEINHAFESSDTLVVELDSAKANTPEMQHWILQHGLYPKGETLQDHLQPEIFERLTDYLQQHQIPLQMVERQKPGLLASTLSSWQMVASGLSPQLGIDAHFINRARDDKAILELESVEQQLLLLINLPDPNRLLKNTLEQLEAFEETLRQIVDYWKTGDEQGLASLIFTEPPNGERYSTYYQTLFVERNQQMANKIESYLQQPGSYFVVVGAGHLVGPENIVQLLGERGFRPTPR